MGIFRKERQTPETLLFLADAEEQAARSIRRDSDRSDDEETAAKASDRRADDFRGRAARARKSGAGQ